MKTDDAKSDVAAPARTVWEVKKVPAGTNTVKVGGVLAGVGARLNLTEEQSTALNKALAGCVEFVGV